MEEFLLGFGMLLGFFVWKAWKKTALDQCRDRLFDIRDDARRYFISRNIPLDHGIYVSLRRLLNAHIRYTLRMTFPRYLSMTFAMRSNPELMAEMRAELESLLKSNDPELSAYIATARRDSSNAMIKYIGETSAFIIFVVALAWPFTVVMKIVKALISTVQNQNKIMLDGVSTFFSLMQLGICVLFKAIPLALVSLVMTMPARAGVFDINMTSASMLEEYSYEASLLK